MTAPKRHTRPPASDKPEANPANRKGQGRARCDEWFAARLQQALDGRPQTWLAEKTGLSTSTIHDYMRGAIPSADRAFLLARALGVDAEWLITGKDDSGRNLEVDSNFVMTRISHADLMEGLDAPLRTRIGKIPQLFEYTLLELTGQDFRYIFATPMPEGGFQEIAGSLPLILCARATTLAPGGYYLVRLDDHLEVRLLQKKGKRLLLVSDVEGAEPIDAPPLIRQGGTPPFIVARVLGNVAKLLFKDKSGKPISLLG